MRLRRRAARAVARRLPRLMPPHLSEWGEVMAAEIEHVEGDGAALAFALACLRGVLAERVRSPVRGAGSDKGETVTNVNAPLGRIALAAGLVAVGTGLLFMAVGGAPPTYLLVNGLTALLALLSWPYVRRFARLTASRPVAVAVLCAAALMATALFGRGIDGVTRWVAVGPVSLQISFLALPLLMAVAARRSSPVMTTALALAAASLALQPDRAMAAAFAAALAVAAVSAPDRWRLVALVCSAAAAVAAFALPDPMPAVPFVDSIVPLAAGSGFPFAALVAVAMLVPVLPFLIAGAAGGPAEAMGRALAAGWAGFAIAAFLGNYPSPLVGYGASAILGYALSCAMLIEMAGARRRPAEGAREKGFSTMAADSAGTRHDQKRKAVPT